MGIKVGSKVKSGIEKWEIDSEIARGRFGVVFHATRKQPKPGEAAVKVPTQDVRTDPIWSKKFAREARILGNSPPHPNVVQVRAVWKFPDGEVAVVQEFVPNARTLSGYIYDQDVDRLSALLQALYALRAIHGGGGAGIIHRDIAPGNVLVDKLSGAVKLIDFGLAREAPRVTEVLTGTGAVFGTRGCIAPEQRRDPRTADQRSDLYGLGKLFAAGLKGRDPEDAEPDRLPPPWRSICSALCQFDAGDRPQTADDTIDLVIQAATLARIAITDLERHIEEVQRRGVEPKGWAGFCSVYFAKRIEKGLLDLHDLHLAAKLRVGLFEDEEFEADKIFEGIEIASSIGGFFRSGGSTFDGVDPYGSYLLNTYDALSNENRTRCFRSLVRAAVDYHRYLLMGYVRTIYAHERKQVLRSALLAILEAEDQEGIIHGRGVIPRAA
jgi:serine/threonine protein kinase